MLVKGAKGSLGVRKKGKWGLLFRWKKEMADIAWRGKFEKFGEGAGRERMG